MKYKGAVPMRVPLSLACGAYDRTAALARGDIRPEGSARPFWRRRWRRPFPG